MTRPLLLIAGSLIILGVLLGPMALLLLAALIAGGYGIADLLWKWSHRP